MQIRSHQRSLYLQAELGCIHGLSLCRKDDAPHANHNKAGHTAATAVASHAAQAAGRPKVVHCFTLLLCGITRAALYVYFSTSATLSFLATSSLKPANAASASRYGAELPLLTKTGGNGPRWSRLTLNGNSNGVVIKPQRG